MAYKDLCKWQGHYAFMPQEETTRRKQLVHLQNLMNDFPDEPHRYAGLCVALCNDFHVSIEQMVSFCLYARKEGIELTPEWIFEDGYALIGRD